MTFTQLVALTNIKAKLELTMTCSMRIMPSAINFFFDDFPSE